MKRFKLKYIKFVKFLIIIVSIANFFVNGSEFPERECCDPIYPTVPNVQDSLPPDISTIASTHSSSISPIGRSGKKI